MAGLFKAGRMLPASLIFLLLLFAGCVKHKTRVQVPTAPSPAPASGVDNSAKKTLPPAPSAPVVPEPKSKPESAAKIPQPVEAEIPAILNIPGPPIRIGLTTTAKEIKISSPGEFSFSVKKPEAARQELHGETVIRAEQEVDETLIYRIQVRSFTKSQAAEELRKKLAQRYDLPVVIHESSASGSKQVRIGEFETKKDAQDFLKTLAMAGYRDAFLVKDTLSKGVGKTTLALRGAGKLFRLSAAGFLFFPAGADFLQLDGKPYRGFFDVFLNAKGQITVVNQLGMEEYLLGVVPAEISPASYPEFAALAAQSIAARTYALKNTGQYRSEGFDLTADTRSQVYTGVSEEKEMTTDAVRRTAGIALYYHDDLIEAMYMSTCGGRTEDFSNVFDAPPVPYLKSVFCAVESGSESGETTLSSTHELEQILLADDGTIANRNLEFARILGIAEGPGFSAEYLSSPAEENEITRWVEKTRKLLSKTQSGHSPSRSEITTRAGFLRFAAESIFGPDEIKRRISPGDVEYYLGNLSDGSSVPEAARYALCYLMQAGLWRPSSDNGVQPKERIRRSETLFLLLRWIESAQPEMLRKGTFVAAAQSQDASIQDALIRVKWGSRTQDFRFSKDLHLFRIDSGRTTPVTRARIIGNEKLSFHLNAAGAIDFMEIELNPTGAASDRYSPVATWEVTLTRASIGEKIRSLAPNIGEFRDLKPSRIGNSGRAVQIQVTGSRGSTLVNGFKIRSALGLRDTLFTISRQQNPDGSTSSFTFHGRGWGHGVGLCQVGAFGMAKAGRSYEEILKTYYQGVQIKRAY